MDQNEQKKVDDTWKTQVEKEKLQAQEKKQPYHQPTFSIFVSSLSMQAMMALGKLENPLTKKSDKNPEQARFLIDTLAIIKDKTKNNLDQEEQTLIDEALYSLRMMYVQETKA